MLWSASAITNQGYQIGMITGNAPRSFLTLSYMPSENLLILQQIDSIDTLVEYMPSLLDSTQLISFPLITTLRFGTPQLHILPPSPNSARILYYNTVSCLSIDIYWLKHCSLSSEVNFLHIYNL